MNEYIVAFDLSDPNYYQRAVKELEVRKETKDYGLSYRNLIQLFDENAIITSVNFNPLDEIPEDAVEHVLEIVHHSLLFPSSFTADNFNQLGENLAEVLSNYYLNYSVSFISKVDFDHLESLAYKYSLPVPEAIEEL